MGGKEILITGVVVSGLGEGAFFMSMPHYRNEIKKKLGFGAYPGTPNLNAKEKQINSLRNIEPIKISGYKSNGKIFGGAICFKAKIKDIDGAIIIPDFTKHKKEVIEFIAPVHIKSELKIKDGDNVKIELE